MTTPLRCMLSGSAISIYAQEHIWPHWLHKHAPSQDGSIRLERSSRRHPADGRTFGTARQETLTLDADQRINQYFGDWLEVPVSLEWKSISSGKQFPSQLMPQIARWALFIVQKNIVHLHLRAGLSPDEIPATNLPYSNLGTSDIYCSIRAHTHPVIGKGFHIDEISANLHPYGGLLWINNIAISVLSLPSVFDVARDLMGTDPNFGANSLIYCEKSDPHLCNSVSPHDRVCKTNTLSYYAPGDNLVMYYGMAAVPMVYAAPNHALADAADDLSYLWNKSRENHNLNLSINTLLSGEFDAKIIIEKISELYSQFSEKCRHDRQYWATNHAWANEGERPDGRRKHS